MTGLPFNSLEQFARTAEAVAATTKKLEKAALLGEYFAHLSDADLARAARYFAGHQFAQSDARTTNVGGSILGEALVAATNVARFHSSQHFGRRLAQRKHQFQSAPWPFTMVQALPPHFPRLFREIEGCSRRHSTRPSQP